MESADLILFLMDTSVQISEEDIEILQKIRDKKKIILLNKSDKVQEEGSLILLYYRSIFLKRHQ